MYGIIKYCILSFIQYLEAGHRWSDHNKRKLAVTTTTTTRDKDDNGSGEEEKKPPKQSRNRFGVSDFGSEWRVAWVKWLPKKSITLTMEIRHFVVSFGPTTMSAWRMADGGTWERIVEDITQDVSFIVVVRINAMSAKKNMYE